MENKNNDKESPSFLAIGISLGVVFGIILDKLALCIRSNGLKI